MNITMENDNNLQQSILEKIEHGKIKMKPRYFFVIGSALIASGLLLFVVLSAFFVNHISYLSRTSPTLSFAGIGPRGIPAFLSTFPWVSLIIASLSIVGGIFLLKKYDFSYKTNFVKLIVIFVISIIVMGIIVDKSGINEPFTHMGPMRGFYQQQFDSDDWVVGVITSHAGNLLSLYSPTLGTIKVQISNNTHIPPHLIIRNEEQLTIFGSWDNDIFVAEDIYAPRFPNFPRPSGAPVSPRNFR